MTKREIIKKVTRIILEHTKPERIYLDFTGIGCMNPRSCFKEAFSQGLIDEENVWLDMIEMRKLSTHVYDEEEIKEILERLDAYKKAFEKLRQGIASHLENL